MGCFHTESPIRKKCVSFHTNTLDLNVNPNARIPCASSSELPRTSVRAAGGMGTGCRQGGRAGREPLGQIFCCVHVPLPPGASSRAPLSWALQKLRPDSQGESFIFIVSSIQSKVLVSRTQFFYAGALRSGIVSHERLWGAWEKHWVFSQSLPPFILPQQHWLEPPQLSLKLVSYNLAKYKVIFQMMPSKAYYPKWMWFTTHLFLLN